MKSKKYQINTPIDGSVIAEYSYSTTIELEKTLSLASIAQKSWKKVSLDNKKKILHRALEIVQSQKDEIAEEICKHIGRPISQCPGEVNGFSERMNHMVDIAEDCLNNINCSEKLSYLRYIKRIPIGVVVVIAPWNYPYMTSINSIAPALMAGNSVILKHAAQTTSCAERLVDIFREAGLPDGILQYVCLNHDDSSKFLGDKRIEHVIFTGSVNGGHKILAAMTGNFASSALELGGKDPAYVLSDCKFEDTIENLVDGSFYNSGQSCCGIERIYVNENIYDRFVDAFVEKTKLYNLTDPQQKEATLGPVVHHSAATFIRNQINQAVYNGAKALIAREHFLMDDGMGLYLAPQVLIDVDHSMDVMAEETFGPLVGIMKVKSDEEALSLMNDSKYGLTASVWTSNIDHAVDIGNKVETGTFYVNRCDYLDPELAWTGVKDTGRGISLSTLAYNSLTRAKSFHIKL